MNWFKVEVIRAHKGTCKDEYAHVYIYGDNIIDILDRYTKMPGTKGIKGRFFPNITPLSGEEAVELEKKIEEESRISVEEAKESWYYQEIE